MVKLTLETTQQEYRTMQAKMLNDTKRLLAHDAAIIESIESDGLKDTKLFEKAEASTILRKQASQDLYEAMCSSDLYKYSKGEENIENFNMALKKEVAFQSEIVEDLREELKASGKSEMIKDEPKVNIDLTSCSNLDEKHLADSQGLSEEEHKKSREKGHQIVSHVSYYDTLCNVVDIPSKTIDSKHLIGKTIKSISSVGINGYDDVPYLKLDFEDGTTAVISSESNNNFTGKSIKEYPQLLKIYKDIKSE